MASLKVIFSSVMAVILFFVAATIANDFIDQQKTTKDYATVTLYSETGTGKQLKIKAEIADTDEERETGLMFRQSLGKGEGMLFIFPNAAVQNFWMKNTLIPLDMIFIAENGTIVKIHHAAPCQADPCLLYNSGQPIKYVLEVNENLTAAYGIQEGSSRVKVIR